VAGQHQRQPTLVDNFTAHGFVELALQFDEFLRQHTRWVLKKPERTAWTALKGSPMRNKGSPRRSERCALTSVSRCNIRVSEKPAGRHSSRSAQLEQTR
jgi:hypothetical protein